MKIIRYRPVWLSVIYLGLLLTMVSHSGYSETLVNFYYEEQELKPYYMGKGRLPPENQPGVFIDMLQQVDENLEDVAFRFHRRPWKRCLDKLQKNRADAVIGNYKPERETFGHYPKTDQQLAQSLVVASSKYCLFTRTSSPLNWSGSGFENITEKPVAVPQGYSVLSILKNHDIPFITTNSTRAGLDLLVKGRVEAAVTFCDTGEQVIEHSYPEHSDIKAQHPELLQSNAYLIFSQKFYSEHPKLAEKIWQEVARVREESYLSLLKAYDLSEP